MEHFLIEFQSKRNGYASAYYRTAEPGGLPAKAYGPYWVKTAHYFLNFTLIYDHTKFNSAYLQERIEAMPWDHLEMPTGTVPYNSSILSGREVRSGFLETPNWAPNTTLFNGLVEQSRFRISATSKDHPHLHERFLKVTETRPYTYTANGEWEISQVEPLNIDLPTGNLKTNWIELKATMTNGLDTKVSLLPVEMTVAFGLGPEPLGPKTSRELLETYLETNKVSRTGDTWFVKFTDAQGVEKLHGVEIVTTKEKLIAALKRVGQRVVFDGHSNFGLGPNFSGKVTHKTIADFTHFGVGKTSIPKSFRGDGAETDVVPFTNGDGTTLPTNPQDLAAIERVHSEGWAYLKLEPGQIIEAPQNHQITELGIERFKNLQGVAPGSTFTKQGNGFNNEWHFDSPEGSRRLVVQAPSTDVPTLGYSKFFYNACNTGRDYIDSFKHGDFFYTKDSCRVEKATTIFVQGIIEGKSNDQIMTDLNQDGVGSSGNPPPQIYECKTF